MVISEDTNDFLHSSIFATLLMHEAACSMQFFTLDALASQVHGNLSFLTVMYLLALCAGQ